MHVWALQENKRLDYCKEGQEEKEIENNPYQINDVAQSISRQTFTVEVRIRSQVSPCGNCIEQSGNGTGLFSSTSVSPVSIIPPITNKHSFNYHSTYKIFATEYTAETYA
jgi:hypothetical protein